MKENSIEEEKEILNKMKNKYKLALFAVIRNSIIMTKSTKAEKTKKEINGMAYETMCSVLTMIDYKKAEEYYKEGKGGRK